ncbi:MAG: FYDLN acid domain-containing protein, partial [Pseudomonadota bacterium]
MSKGLKRICMSCGIRFYDMNKKPIICPTCDWEFTGEVKVK